MDRAFLDANVLFSAAYRRNAGLQRLWKLPAVTLLTSPFALEEARRNLSDRWQRGRLTRMMRVVTLVPDPADRPLPVGISLPEKDRPILLAAVDGNQPTCLPVTLPTLAHISGGK